MDNNQPNATHLIESAINQQQCIISEVLAIRNITTTDTVLQVTTYETIILLSLSYPLNFHATQGIFSYSSTIVMRQYQH